MTERKHLGAVRDVESLKGRCVVDADTGCWHLRDSFGRPIARKDCSVVPKVFVHQLQKRFTARNAAWMLSGRGKVPHGMQLVMRCRCWDCANPAHVVAMTDEKFVALLQSEGAFRSPAKTAGARRTARNRPSVKLTEELAQWARESPQTQAEVAHALGTRQNRISEIRRFKTWRPHATAATVFDVLLRGVGA